MSTSKQRIHLSIGFGDAILPVIRGDDGHDRVPLRPIATEIGISWPRQTRKLTEGKYLNRRLGIKSCCLKASGTAQICIRVDRVEAFLNTLNPENIRGMGNTEAADWLEAKHTEWDDVLHAYENNQQRSNTSAPSEIVRLINARERSTHPGEKEALTRLIHRLLNEQGVVVAPDPQAQLPFASNQA